MQKKTLELPLQPASLDVWRNKYKLKSKDQKGSETCIDDTYKRVAKALSDVEKPDLRARYYQEFLWALRKGAIPAGRIISNAGAHEKNQTSTINCTVSGKVSDSMDDILTKVYEAGLTLKAGCGIGYEFSGLRPRNAYVSGSGSYTSGPLSFMDIYDRMCCTISSAGGRRGAQMATFDIHHPDVMDFIKAKREDGRLRQFNLSLLITSEFIEAVKAKADWTFSFPILKSQENNKEVMAGALLWRPISKVFNTDDYISNDKGEIGCLCYHTMPAIDIWDAIMEATYDFAEPGFILIDHANELNNNWFMEFFRSVNPCGEQLLPYYGSCLLGSINLVKFVLDPFTSNARFDFSEYAKVIQTFTRMLDNVVEINNLPLPQQREEIKSKRRHGMGYMGLGSSMIMLGMRYGDPKSIAFTDKVTRYLAIEGWRASLALSKEKGMAPALKKEYVITPDLLNQRPEMKRDGYALGDKVPGRVLHSKYSRYMQRIATVEPALVNDLIEYGARFTHHSSIAPTGTIALSIGNNVSNGIEPSFMHSYIRNIIVPGKKTKESVNVESYEFFSYKSLVNKDAVPDASLTTEENGLPDNFITTKDLSPKDHIEIQSTAQYWIDASISKTINVPTDFPFESFKSIYMEAYEKGLKGCTTFRFNPEAFQGVLVNEKDLDDTQYAFELENGETFVLRGNDSIEYDGETHTAANLYDALKEKMYGKF